MIGNQHLDAWSAAGLITLVEERPKRGNIERSYQAIANRFEVEPQILSDKEGELHEGATLIPKMFRETAKDLVKLTEKASRGKGEEQQTPLIAKLSFIATEQQIEKLRRKLQKWIDECDAETSNRSKKLRFGQAGCTCHCPFGFLLKGALRNAV